MQSGNLVPVFAVLGIAGLFFWLVPPAQGEWLNGFIKVLGGGFWVWVVVRAVARPLLHRRWERWEREMREMGERERWEAVPRFPPSYGRMADREPLKSHIMRWWEGSSPDARAYSFAFVLVVSTAVWQHRTGGELVISAQEKSSCTRGATGESQRSGLKSSLTKTQVYGWSRRPDSA